MLAVIRVRGSVKVDVNLEKTMELLRLDRANRLVLVPEEKSLTAMVKKVSGFVTYGTVDAETLARLLAKRGRLQGDKRLTEAYVKEKKFKGFREMAEAVAGGKASLQELGVKPVFRLSPPSKGFERGGIKKPFGMGGVLGDRGPAINALVQRMM